MTRFRFEPLNDDDRDGIDLTGVGISLDDLDLDNLDLDPDVLTMLDMRHRHRCREWWHTTDAESHFLDTPNFESAGDRARHFVEASGRAYLQTVGADEDAPVFEYFGEMISLNDMLARMDYESSRIMQVEALIDSTHQVGGDPELKS